MRKLTEDIVVALRTVLDTKEFKDSIEATEKAADADSGTFEVVITTENLDRYNEVIKLDGWDTEHYMKNAVVLWGHDHHLLPIGLCTSLTIADGKMIAKGKFATHAHAQEVRKLYDLGIVKATSVGFIEKEREGNLITQAELIEFSFVSVPANPYALSLAMEGKLSINELVTKGFMDLVKEAEPVEQVNEEAEEAEETSATEEVPAEETVPEEPTVPEETEQKAFDTKAFEPIVEQARSLVIALEALVKSEEPERKEDEEPVAEEDDAALKAFAEKRRVVQEAATIIGDVLADMRQVVEAQK